MYKKFETSFAGRKLVVETGKMANLSNGSCLVRYGDTAVLVNANMSKEPKEGIDFLPLSVDYDERLYAVGKIPGGYIKREGKPSTKAILVSRVIDRPLRPLFPKDYRNDTAIDALVSKVDLRGSWSVANLATDYTIKYTSNNTLQVSLLSDGDFKINYQNAV